MLLSLIGSSEGSTYVESETFLDEEATASSQGTSVTGGSSSTGTADGTADAETTQTVDVASSETETAVNAPPPSCRSRARVCCTGKGKSRTLCGCRYAYEALTGRILVNALFKFRQSPLKFLQARNYQSHMHI